MSGLDLDATIRRSIATLLHASYTDHEPTETTDVWRTIAADARRDLDALITRLRAAEARTAWQPAADVQHPVEMGLVTLAHKCGWCRSGPPCESPMVTDGWSGGDGQWYTHGSLDGWRVTHYQPYPAPALPAAPEAPHG